MNKNYYLSKNGKSIMDISNFSYEIIRMLTYEQAFISKMLSIYKYDSLVEFGCDKVRMLGISQIHDINYIGIDIRGGDRIF